MLKLKNSNRKINFYSAIFLSGLLLFSAFPAGAKTGETEKKAQDETAAPVESAKNEKEERKYIYDQIGKTDPFKSFILTQEQKKETVNEKPRTYLETLELSQLRLSVIIIGKKDRWAMVKDNKGVGHVIKVGTPIGINRGVVHNILPGEVIIREEYRNIRSGEKEFRDVSKKTPSVR